MLRGTETSQKQVVPEERQQVHLGFFRKCTSPVHRTVPSYILSWKGPFYGIVLYISTVLRMMGTWQLVGRLEINPYDSKNLVGINIEL